MIIHVVETTEGLTGYHYDDEAGAIMQKARFEAKGFTATIRVMEPSEQQEFLKDTGQ